MSALFLLLLCAALWASAPASESETPILGRSWPEKERSERWADLREALARARRAGNAAEAREIMELMEQLEHAALEPRREKSDAPPEPPHGFRVIGSYGRNAAIWRSSERIQVGVRIERREPGRSEWNVVTPNLVYDGRWFDDEVETGRTYEYRAATVNRAGIQSPSSPICQATPADPAKSTLPIYRIEVPSAEWQFMVGHPFEEVTVRGRFAWKGLEYPVELRVRGRSSRHAVKKSFRLRFVEETPLERKVTYLKAEPFDFTLQQEKLTCDVFEQAGAWVSQSRYVNLLVNGRHEGVYVDIEPIRSPFKEKAGLNPEGTLIRANTFQQLAGWERLGERVGSAGRLSELSDFIHAINRTDRGEFESWVKASTDWDRLLDYLALSLICHRSEIEADDYFYYRDSRTKKWSLIPWDHNNGNFGVLAHRHEIARPFIHLYPQTVQDIGWRPSHWYALPSRIFQHPALRAEYFARIQKHLAAWFGTGKVDQMIERNYAAIRTEYVLDPYRQPFVGDDPFLESNALLKRFVRRHVERIAEMIRREEQREAPFIVINEFSFDWDEGWVELRNLSFQDQPLKDYSLVMKNQDGNWELPLPESAVIPARGFYVVRSKRLPRDHRAADWERLEEVEFSPRTRRRLENSFPGFDPGGGFFALARRTHPAPADPEPDADGLEEKVIDFYFYGAHPPGFSYGRDGETFSRLQPTPGSPNRRHSSE